MAYQIPQQLEYKERIMFGLTFKQLIYALIFGSLSLLFFRKMNNFHAAVIFGTLSSLTGTAFMFFNLEEMIKNYFIFFKFRNLKKGDEKLKKFIGVKEIKKNVIITLKNKKVSVLKVRPINFSIKQTEEQEAIILSFQKFLNSLDFPTQIIMNTENLELKRYLSSLKSRLKGKTFLKLFKDYKQHLQNTISSNKIMNRVFYLIIPEKNDIEIQTDICIDRLRALNLKVERLNCLQLKKLLVNCFLGNKGKDFLPSISPKYIKNNSDHLEINKKYYRIVHAHGYPRNVETGFLDRIVSSLGDFDLSMHIKPYPIENMLIDLNRELQKQRADLYSMKHKGIINPSLEIQYNDTRNTLKNLQKGKERLFNISLYIMCRADSVKELDLLTKKVESELNSIMILPKTATLRMLQGFKSIAPLGEDSLNISRNIATEALSAFFPFTSQFLQADD
ncbi:MAG: PrgI family protein, partial [Nanoarchaeota archaeon]|nr:PrgI family protein [Nanoarchaeota archaeon]